MNAKKKQRTGEEIRFSIGAKLIIIISFIVIISLGSITALISWLVQRNLRASAEVSNLEMNHLSRMEAETTLTNAHSSTRILIQTITALERQPDVIRESTDFFFAENPQIAAVFFIIPGKDEQILANSRFFSTREIKEELVVSYFNGQREALGRAVRGETALQNAAPHFARLILALFFPWQNGGAGCVLFSSENMYNNFGSGINQSYMINSGGDILVHPDFSLVRNGTNIGNMNFVRQILNVSGLPDQWLAEEDFGVLLASGSSVNAGIFSDILESVKSQFQRLFGKKPEVSQDEESFENTGERRIVRQYIAFQKLDIAGMIVITSIEYDKIFEAIAATIRHNIYLSIAVLSISIIFIWFFSKTISIPLKSLAQAAKQIESGVFEIELRSKSKDEIGVLTSSFHKMCSALHIFGRFTNREIAVKAMRGEIKPGGFPRHGTVFFSDIREFTAKSENFTKVFGNDASDKIVQWLNEYFTQMIDCVEKTNGVVDKFIGDAVMAHWGTAYTAGSPRKDAFNCVKAALMMRKELYFMNKDRKAGDPANPSIRIGCGINTGIVTAGQLGSDMRMEYTVIGDPVNLASRIEALTKPLGADILISEDTWTLVGDKFITEEMPSVTVKGKEKPVRIFAVVNFMGEPKGPQTMEEVRDLLGIMPVDLEKVDVNADEKKYKIGE
jgi:adenylate cyclase